MLQSAVVRRLTLLAVVVGLIGSGCGDVSELTQREPDRGTARSGPDALLRADDSSWPLSTRLRGAERVVVATVQQVSAKHGFNEYGDALILSEITLEVQESLRGDAQGTATFTLEGGTVGELTLRVSDLPTLVPGDRGVFALRRSPAGETWLPNGRALGIILTTEDADLEPFREAERTSR